MKYVELKNRSIIEVTGDDRVEFLQDLVTVDVEKLSENNALWAGLLSPQGKYLHDFFLYHGQDKIYVDVHNNSLNNLKQQLNKYTLRADVDIIHNENISVFALWNKKTGDDDWLSDDFDSAPSDGGDAQIVWSEHYQIVSDPRTVDMGLRMVGSHSDVQSILASHSEATKPDYTALRISCGVVDPAQDMVGIEFYWPEINSEQFNGIDYQKGCFVGQEVTARLKHKAKLKKKVVRVTVMGEPEVPSELATDISQIGTLLAYSSGVGLAYVRLDRWENAVETLRSVMAGSSLIYKAA